MRAARHGSHFAGPLTEPPFSMESKLSLSCIVVDEPAAPRPLSLRPVASRPLFLDPELAASSIGASPSSTVSSKSTSSSAISVSTLGAWRSLMPPMCERPQAAGFVFC